MDLSDDQGGLKGHSVRIVPVLVRYRVSFSKALFPQLQFWHLYCLVFVQSMGGLCVRVSYVFHFVSHTDVNLIVETQQRPGDVDLDNAVQIDVRQFPLQYCKHRGLNTAHAAVFCV